MLREETNKRVKSLLDDVEGTNRYVTIRNPSNKRIVHVINREKKDVLMGPPCYSSVCNNYDVVRMADDTFDEMTEIRTRAEIEGVHEICSNCQKQLFG